MAALRSLYLRLSLWFLSARYLSGRAWSVLRHQGLKALINLTITKQSEWRLAPRMHPLLKSNKGMTAAEKIMTGDSFKNIDTLTASRSLPLASVVIPVFNGLDYVRQCIDSLYRSPIGFSFELIVVDQASSDGTREMLRKMACEHSDFYLIENEQNTGFGIGINQGVSIARGEYIAVCNSDLVFTTGWLDRLVAAARKDPGLAVVSPVTNYVGEGIQLDTEAADVTPETAEKYAQWVAGRASVLPVVDRLVFFCVLIRKNVFDLLGGLADVFGMGNYEDDDFCLRARLIGYRLAIIPSSFVFHHGSRTFKEQQISHTDWMVKNEAVYYERVVNFSTRLPVVSSPRTASEPQISVVLRTKDRPVLVKQSLTSLTNQTFKNFEVVVIIDGGIDISPLLQEFDPYLSIRYVYHQVAKGRPQALNAGLEAAKGAWITYLDDDDIFYPTHLESLMTAVSLEHGICAVYTDANKALYWSDPLQGDLFAVHRERFARQEFDLGSLLVDNWIPILTLLHEAQLARQLGGFDNTLGIYEDWDFLIRLAHHTKVRRCPKVTCEYRFRFDQMDSDSTLYQREQALEARLQIYKRYSVTNPKIEEIRAVTLAAARQKMDYARKIDTMNLSPLQRNYLIALRLGGFPLPASFSG